MNYIPSTLKLITEQSKWIIYAFTIVKKTDIAVLERCMAPFIQLIEDMIVFATYEQITCRPRLRMDKNNEIFTKYSMLIKYNYINVLHTHTWIAYRIVIIYR